MNKAQVSHSFLRMRTRESFFLELLRREMADRNSEIYSRWRGLRRYQNRSDPNQLVEKVFLHAQIAAMNIYCSLGSLHR